MAYSDTTRKAEATGGGVGSLAVTLNSTVAGNLVVVGVSSYNNASSAPSAAGSDGGNTWSQAFTRTTSNGTERQEGALVYSVLGTGGNRTITIDPGASTYDMWIAAHEFSGPHATPLSGTPVTNGATASTTADTTSFTPADADCLYVAVEGHAASGTIAENNATGDTNWTLSNENESGSAAEPGSMVFFIRSGTAVARRAAWTIPSTYYAAGIAGFKPDAGTPPVTARPGPAIGRGMGLGLGVGLGHSL